MEPRPSGDWIVDVDGRVQYGINFGKTRGFIHSCDPITLTKEHTSSRVLNDQVTRNRLIITLQKFLF